MFLNCTMPTAPFYKADMAILEFASNFGAFSNCQSLATISAVIGVGCIGAMAFVFMATVNRIM